MDHGFVPLVRVPLTSVSRLFPDIEPSILSAVLNHTLRARDLYLLDPRVRDVEPTYIFNGFTSCFEPSTSKFREYATLGSVIIPLHNYFAILLAHNPEAHALPTYIFSYLTQLQMLAADYAWEAVLGYHTLFFNRHIREMEASGDYSAWSGPDISLLGTYVYPDRSSSSPGIHSTCRLSTATHPPPSAFDASRRRRPRAQHRRPCMSAAQQLELLYRRVDPT
ncbi:hypothetical protein B0H14DRAFT_2367343 [Mycena olivaceomarginata]|nr:hypothetical protein B0H14DRAFT_2367343 [Mycena olivaceomarginata]